MLANVLVSYVCVTKHLKKITVSEQQGFTQLTSLWACTVVCICDWLNLGHGLAKFGWSGMVQGQGIFAPYGSHYPAP